MLISLDWFRGKFTGNPHDLNGKNHGFRLRFSQPINPMMINLTCRPQSLRPQMNLVNLSTALHRVAKIVGNDAWLQAPNTLGRSAGGPKYW